MQINGLTTDSSLIKLGISQPTMELDGLPKDEKQGNIFPVMSKILSSAKN